MYKIRINEDRPDIGYMEYTLDKLMKRGIRISDCDKLRLHYNVLRDQLKSEIQTKYHIDNPNSPKQITEYLQEVSSKFDLVSRNDIVNICYDSESNKWTSNADALEKLSDLGYEFARDLLDYRHAKKYAEVIESIAAELDKNSLIHPMVSLGRTNRVNYSRPALLNIPKELLWHMILPYDSDSVLYSVDIKNQEPHILISMTGAEELKYALESEEGLYETMFKQCFAPKTVANVLIDTLPENRVYSISELKSIGTISPAYYSAVKPMIKDTYYLDKKVIGIETICIGSEKGLHANLPKTVDIETEDGKIYSVEVEWEDDTKKFKKNSDYTLEGALKGVEVRVGKAERKEFKTAWNSISYGASLFGVKMACKVIDGKQTYNYITKNNQLKDYRSKIDKLSKQGVNTIGTIFGTKLFAGDHDDAKKLKRVLLDLPIQGTGADILSLLIKHFYDYTEQQKLNEKISLYFTRHDEVIIEIKKDWIAEVGEENVVSTLKDIFEHQIEDWTPFKVEISKTEASSLDM